MRRLVLLSALLAACSSPMPVSGSSTETGSGEAGSGEPWLVGDIPAERTEVYDANGEHLGALRDMTDLDFNAGADVMLTTADGWHRTIAPDGHDMEGNTFGRLYFAEHNCSGAAHIPSTCAESPLSGFPLPVVHFDTVWGPVTNQPAEFTGESYLTAAGQCVIEDFQGCAVRAHYVATTPAAVPLELREQ